jgi:hypothetical protein
MACLALSPATGNPARCPDRGAARTHRCARSSAGAHARSTRGAVDHRGFAARLGRQRRCCHDDKRERHGQQLALAERLFAPANQGKALIAVALIPPPSGKDVNALAPQLQDGTLLRSLANGITEGSVADFALTGSQGVGEADQSATFTGTMVGSGGTAT